MPIFKIAETLWEQGKKRRQRILAMVRKELDWVIHDRLSMFILFFLPVLMIATIGNVEIGGVEGEEEAEKASVVWIIDNDNSNLSLAYIDSLRSENFSYELYDNHENQELVSVKEAKELIPTPQLQAYIIIPEDFNESLSENRSTTVDIYIDGIDLLKSIQLKYEFKVGTLLYQLDYQVFNSEVLYLPKYIPEQERSLLETVFPFLITNVLFAVVNMVSCQSVIADEPLKRMLIAPTRKLEVILAKMLAYSFLSLLLTFVCLTIAVLIFEVPLISFFNSFLIAFLSAFFGITLGILFSTLATSRLQAAQLFLFSYIMQVLLVTNLRIDPIVNYLSMELSSTIFTDVAYRGLTMAELGLDLFLILSINALLLLLAFISLSLKRQEV